MNIQIRTVDRRDLPLILDFIQQKAMFDGCPTSVEATKIALEKTLFEQSLAQVLLAEVDGEAIGFATFFSTYSTFLARPGIWLDDLYVQPHLRGQGVGTALINHLIAIAQRHHCKRIEWSVATNNALGINFYQKQGAVIRDDVKFCRLTLEPINPKI